MNALTRHRTARWASPAGTIWLATGQGVYRRETAGDWSQVFDQAVGSITGTSDGDVWVTLGGGENPTPRIARFDGTTWTVENTGAGQPIRRVWVTPSTVFVAGRNGGILRRER